MDNTFNVNAQAVANEVTLGRDGTLNYSIGFGTSEEANYLGRAWVGDGAKSTSNGGLISADGTRSYRPPSLKPNSKQASTGTQANFETWSQKLDGTFEKVKNGHLNISY